MSSKLHCELNTPAKTNLYLKVAGKLESGMHQIRSLFAPISLSDKLSLSIYDSSSQEIEILNQFSPELELHLKQSLGSTEEILQELNSPANLAFKAAELFLNHTGESKRLEISIEKAIPLQAGLGGGSSNSASVLLALNSNLGQPLGREQLIELAAQIGSDVPAFIEEGLIFVHGTGNKLLPIRGKIRDLDTSSLVIIKPPAGVSTKLAYDGLFHQAGSAISDELNLQKAGSELAKFGISAGSIADSSGDLAVAQNDWMNGISNDFEASVFESYPLIKDCYETVQSILSEQFDSLGSSRSKVFMSGSGSALVVVFENDSSNRKAEGLFEVLRSTFSQDYWLGISKFICP